MSLQCQWISTVFNGEGGANNVGNWWSALCEWVEVRQADTVVCMDWVSEINVMILAVYGALW